VDTFEPKNYPFFEAGILYLVVMEGDKNFGNILFLFFGVSVF